MPKIILNGLYPGSGGDPRKNASDALVAVFLSRKYGTPDAELLLEASPDNSGTVIREISNEYIGENITIVLIDLKFEEQNVVKIVNELGVFHTFNLKKNFCYNDNGENREKLNKINTNEMNINAQDSIQHHIRSTKYNNKYIKHGSTVISFGSPLLGLAIAAAPGVIIGLIFSAILYFFTPYIVGDKKW